MSLVPEVEGIVVLNTFGLGDLIGCLQKTQNVRCRLLGAVVAEMVDIEQQPVEVGAAQRFAGDTLAEVAASMVLNSF